MIRPTWYEYFLSMAKLAQTRSTCLRRQVGAVIIKDNRVISTGYNGAAKGLPHCDTIGCLRVELNIPSGERAELCRAVHAEQNAIVQAAFFGLSTEGSTIYVTHQPCIICAKLIIQAGIKRVIYIEGYNDKYSLQMLEDAKIEVNQITI